MRLIAKSEVLEILEDDDDIEWNSDPLEINPDNVKLDSVRGFIRVPGKAEGTV